MPYCPQCGTEAGQTDAFCRSCGTSLEDDSAPQATNPEQSPDPEESIDSTPPDDDSQSPTIAESTPSEKSEKRQTDTSKESSKSALSRGDGFFLGAVLAVIGVVTLPFVFVFVALPESIIAIFGGSIQDSFPEDFRDNGLVSGAMLIMRWFGNFLLLILVVGILGLFLLLLI